VHFGGFAPAFTLSQCDSEYSRKPQDAHSLGRYAAFKKKEKKQNTANNTERKICYLLLIIETNVRQNQ